MNVQINVELPEEVFTATRSTPEHFIKETSLAETIKWYEIGKISQSKAVEIAGISRHDFLEAQSEFGISPFVNAIQIFPPVVPIPSAFIG